MIPSNSTGRAAYGVGFGRVLTGIVGSNPAWGMDISLLSVVFCQLESFASADHSSRCVLPNVVYQGVIVKPRR